MIFFNTFPEPWLEREYIMSFIIKIVHKQSNTFIQASFGEENSVDITAQWDREALRQLLVPLEANIKIENFPKYRNTPLKLILLKDWTSIPNEEQ